MGYFLQMFISVLTGGNNGIKNITEVLSFDKLTFISWEAKGQPSPEWVSKEGIWIKSDTENIESFTYEHDPISKVTTSLIRKQEKWRYTTTFRPNARETLVLVNLPDFFIPENISPVSGRELFRRRIKNHIALTWIPIEKELSGTIKIDFLFLKRNKEKFENYATKLKSFHFFVDPKLKNTFTKTLRYLRNEAKDVVAKVIAETISSV